MNQIILAEILIYQRESGFLDAGLSRDWALRFESFYPEASLNGQKAYRKRGDTNMSQTIQITDEDFEREVLGSEIPVLVDFWAEWCGPCRAVGPVIEEIAEEYEGRIKVAKLNVDYHPETASSYGIRSIPTMIIFRDGEENDRILGALPKKNIVDALEGALERKITA